MKVSLQVNVKKKQNGLKNLVLLQTHFCLFITCQNKCKASMLHWILIKNLFNLV